MDWDLTSYFPTFDGPEYRAAQGHLDAQLQSLAGALETLPLDDAPAWVAWLGQYEQAQVAWTHLGSYIGCLVAADAENEAYGIAEAWLSGPDARMEVLDTRLRQRLGELPAARFAALQSEAGVAGLQDFLAFQRARARESMDPAAEALAAALSVNGIKAWSRLYFTLSGQLQFRLVGPDGIARDVPMAQRNPLLGEADPAFRRRVFAAANETWEGQQATCAAALNSLAGTRADLDQRRGVGHYLDVACQSARIQRGTLEALMQAVEAHLPQVREIFRYRCQRMGLERGGYADLLAPLPLPEQTKLDWDSGFALVERSFDAAYPALGDFLRECRQRRWIEFAARPGKRPGAFCTHSPCTGESRVFMTYAGTLSEVSTLAHEVGHAWHARILNQVRPLAARPPMTLAESASTFAEMLLTDGARSDDFPAPLRLALLESETQRAVSFLLDLPTRFHFECAFHEERRRGVVPVARLRELMVAAQQRVFGDSLDPAGADPLFWCSKLHFYIEDTRFYNFPYTFGFLLSQALHARLVAEGAAFLPAYERFLAQSGGGSCEAIVRDALGEDLGDPAFWSRAIRAVQPAYQALRQQLG